MPHETEERRRYRELKDELRELQHELSAEIRASNRPDQVKRIKDGIEAVQTQIMDLGFIET